ncbi:hypothetical protein TanjilG_15438 [Lupinus angustifolius]|uniref:J domain-containing protein n=1 Tax=Lupinus angustifolius TaxID=3871 RepID=A0A4P1RLI6_LUPAN|nr:PREDICTED: uncharacterized protein LOC109346284 [Lupinus angustifolius]OIW12989.1 hypothetical protein TanjilG_15438 [Lupinus angustifolius]
MAVTSSNLNAPEKKQWWLTNRKIVEKYLKDARNLIATQEENEIASALNIVEAALAIYPRLEQALELRARSLLYLRRFKEVADMLQDYIPSLKMANDDSGSVSSDSSSQTLSREGVNLLSYSVERDQSFKCFSISELKKKVMAGLSKNYEKEGHWRYLVLGKACCHLGLMEDAMVLLQTGKRLASAAHRRESICWSDDSFSLSTININSQPSTPPLTPLTETESITHLLTHIKLLLRRRASALAALDAGLHSEAIRHFSKLLDGRRFAPQGFLAECYMHRANAYHSSGRIAESIGDCNRTLALDPTCIQALETRASILETIRCYTDSLHDLEHLKLLYNTILRDKKLPGPAWKRHNVSYREIPGKLCALTIKIQELKKRVGSGEVGNVDYYVLIGLRKGCSRSELQRAHLLLCLKHKPDKATNFIDRCELANEHDLESVKDRAKMSALLLYRLLQKGYANVMHTIMDEEAAEKQNNIKEALALQLQQEAEEVNEKKIVENKNKCLISSPSIVDSSVFQGVFCRDLSVVGDLLSQVGFNRPIPMKYEGLSC